MNEVELCIEPLGLLENDKRPVVIAGPCSAETEQQVMTTAHQLKALGYKIFRAGIWKPRTHPGGFEGQGKRALPWLKRVKEETGMLVATEVATPIHVEQALNAGLDLLWIGARTTANPFAMQAVADSLSGVDIPVLVKNPLNPDIELWIGALQRLNHSGVKRLGAIHRGFSHYESKMFRNAPMWPVVIELRRRIPGLPIFCDPSHIGGRRDLLLPLCQQAMDLGLDGLVVESHPTPDEAWSDAQQQITPDELHRLLLQLVIRDENVPTESLTALRKEMEDVDDQIMQLLTRRMEISRQMGVYKKEHNMAVLQLIRYNEILDKRSSQGEMCGLSPSFVKKIFENIHEESVRQQIDIMNNGRNE